MIITSVEGCTNKIGDSNFRRQLLLLCKIRSTMSTRKQLFLLHRNSIWLYNRYFLFFKRSTIVNIRVYKSSQILVWTLLRTFFYNVRIPWSPNKLVLLPYKTNELLCIRYYIIQVVSNNLLCVTVLMIWLNVYYDFKNKIYNLTLFCMRISLLK